MSLTWVDVRGRRANLAEVLPRPGVPGDDVREAVARIVDRVRTDGDEALRTLTAELDGVAIDELRVDRDEVHAAWERIPGELRQALQVAKRNIAAYHAQEPGPPADWHPDGPAHGLTVRHLVRPVERAGCYAPGGRARYPSTVLMCAVPARVAGVAEVVLCVPPGADGGVDDATLAAAALAGVDEVYRVGGAQAIAAMAYGTKSIRPVDVVVGPGNQFVAEAKRQVAGAVGVASAFAGPSEVVVVAAPDTPTRFAAVDVVVQAEHGPDGTAWLVTWDEAKAHEIKAEIERLVAASPRREDLDRTLAKGGYVCLVDDARQAVEVSNVVAPEHLELLFDGAEDLLPAVRAAGAVFCGPWAPASLGDYVAGPNHVLPTNRTARFASALRVDDFRRHVHAVSVDQEALGALGPHVVTLATVEGLPAHAASVEVRQTEAGQTGAREPWAPPVRLELRPGLASLGRYHSPQVAAEVRLNTNESPFPPPPGWQEQLAAAVARVPFHRYPDREATELRQGIAALHGVRPEEVFCANGSNEVLQCLLLAYGGSGRRALVFEPTYALHSHIARLSGTEVVSGPRGADRRVDEKTARDLFDEKRPELTFLCSPNNPTGRLEDPGLLATLVALAPGLVVVDEAYGQFSPWSALSLRAGAPAGALAVVRTFSKTWAMAASRLGYLVADVDVVAGCEAAALPYHLSVPTQIAGVLALRYQDQMAERVSLVTEARDRLAEALAALPVESWPSDANFVLFRPLNRSAGEVWNDLLASGVLIRDFSATSGLEGCLRVTVGTPDENAQFLEALRRCLP